MKPQITGLFETHLYVSDLEKSTQFYKEVLGLEQCYHESERRATFFWIGEPKKAMLGLWEKPKEALDIRHFAFQSSAEWILNQAIPFLKQHQIKFWNFLKDGTERPMVFAWMPAISIYFEDPDGHSLEFIGWLNGKPRPENGIISYEEWQRIESEN